MSLQFHRVYISTPKLSGGIPPWLGIIFWLIPTIIVCWAAIKGSVVAKTKKFIGWAMMLPALLWSFISLSQFFMFFNSYSDALHNFVVTLLLITLLLSAIVPFFISLFVFRESIKK